MRTARAFLLALVAASAIVAATGKPLIFVARQSLQETQESGRAHPYQEPEVETVHACLRVIEGLNCQSLDGCTAGTCSQSLEYYETKLGCCDHHGYSYDHPERFFKEVEQANVGSCWWLFNQFDQAPTFGVRGTFDVTCELKDAAEQCGELFCDGVALKAWGQIHQVNNVAIEGQPEVPLLGSCGTPARCFRFGKNGGEAARKTPAAEAPAAKTPAAEAPAAKTPAAEAPAAKSDDKAELQNSKELQYHTVQYFRGLATVLSGYVKVYDPSHTLKAKEGRFQMAPFYYVYDQNAPIVPSPGQLIVRPFEIDMKLKETANY